MVNVMVTRAFSGLTAWTSVVQFRTREHTTTALCRCPVGRWIRDRHIAADNSCPWPDHDPNTQILEREFVKRLIRWERDQEHNACPVVSPRDVPVEQLTESPSLRFDSTHEWTGHQEGQAA